MSLGPAVSRLLVVASDPLAETEPIVMADGPLLSEFADLLAIHNGFYAFESALHVFASGEPAAGGSLEGWNQADSWRREYDGLADGFLFFAEDAFGTQFAVRDEQVHTFDPETGEAEAIASSIENWAELVLADYETLTGFPLVHLWQQRFGPLASGQRLVPKTPFVLGGEFDLSNLYPMDATDSMRLRASLAVQIRDLPDGAQVHYRVVE